VQDAKQALIHNEWGCPKDKQPDQKTPQRTIARSSLDQDADRCNRK
jgi:hypothetical protein